MLILTRKIDQAIIIQGNITVMVLGVERDRVKLGIAAPADVTVLREELVQEAQDPPSPIRPAATKPTLTVRGNLALNPEPEDEK
jgi:carbon storage regulator CsrA